MHSRVAYLGVAFVLVGAVLLVSPTLGFETIAADRTTQIETASDQNALIGFETTGESIDSVGDTATVYTLRNNAEETLTVSANTVVAQSDDVEVDTSGSGEVPAGGTTDVVLRCNGASGSGTTTVTTTVTQATGQTMTITGASSSTSIDYTCEDSGGGPPGSGPAGFVANDPQYDGNQWNQEFEVNVDDLGNNDEFTIDLSDVQTNAGVDYSSATAQVTSGQENSNFEFDKNSWNITYSPQGKTDGPFEITVSDVQLTSDQDGTAYYFDSTGVSDSDTFSVPAIGNDGETDTDGDLVVEDGTDANGDIDAGGTVTISDDATANDDVDAGSDVTVGDSGTVHGDLDSGGDVSIGDEATASNEVDAEGDVFIGAGGTADGEIDAGGDVTLDSGATANSDVTGASDVTINAGGSIQGDVDAGGALTVRTDATVSGEIDVGGTVTAESGSTLNDDVSTESDLYLEDGTTAWGDIDSGGTVYVGCDVSYSEENVDADGGIVNTCNA